MSTRKLTLIITAAALTLAGGVTAASASLEAPPPSPGTLPSAEQPAEPKTELPEVPAAPSPPAVAPVQDDAANNSADAAANETAMQDCRDAECDIPIKDGQEIPLDKKFGMEPIKVEVDGDQVTMTVRSKTAKAVATADASNPHTSAHINGITLRPYKSKDGKLMLKISRD